jgi:hypothetical protein
MVADMCDDRVNLGTDTEMEIETICNVLDRSLSKSYVCPLTPEWGRHENSITGIADMMH